MSPSDLAVDWLERVILVVLYAFLVHRVVSRSVRSDAYGSLFILPAEGLAVVFILVRRSTGRVSRKVWIWVIALAATVAPLLVTTSDSRTLIPAQVGAFVLVAGIFIQLHAKIALGRSMGCVPAHRGLKRHGPYRFVRHPIYSGYLIGHFAYLVMNPIAWNAIVYGVLYSLQIPRLLIEERVLSSDPEYRTYMEDVRYRLIPGFF